jgi:hypothetical protein
VRLTLATSCSICTLALALTNCKGAEKRETTSDTSHAAAPARRTLVVRPESYGPVRFGQPIGVVSSALGERLQAAYSDFESCDYVSARGLPAGTALMVIKDTVMRVDVDSGGIPTAEGARVGDSEKSVLDLYAGRVSVQPHKYTGPVGHYLVVRAPGDSMYALIFETDGKRVTNYRAGRRPAVELVEGCA